MHYKNSSTIAICLLFFFTFTLLFLSLNSNHKQHSEKITIVCTTSMITDTVKAIVGDHANVIGLMGPNVDPHLYRAREGDVHRLSSAHLIFYNGLHLEGRMAHMLATMNTYVPTIAVSQAIPDDMLKSPPEFDGLYDPHIWLSVQHWLLVVDYIRDALITHDQQHANAYRHNADCYSKKLNKLNRYVKREIQRIPIKKRILITAHDAFGYFGSMYTIQVIGLQGISTKSEAGTRDVATLVDIIVSKKIPAIFVESSIPTRTIQAVQHAANARGWNVIIGTELYSDALGNPGTPASTYIGMMQHNVDAIVSALSEQQK